jgi:hypothetical protein
MRRSAESRTLRLASFLQISSSSMHLPMMALPVTVPPGLDSYLFIVKQNEFNMIRGVRLPVTG